MQNDDRDDLFWVWPNTIHPLGGLSEQSFGLGSGRGDGFTYRKGNGYQGAVPAGVVGFEISSFGGRSWCFCRR
jgi:hypothetical protein